MASHRVTLDTSDDRGARAARRLAEERVIWMTTVAADGTPQTSPVWFWWDGEEFLVYSLESPRARNVRSRSEVSLNLDGNGLGGDIVVVEGTARVDSEAPSAAEHDEYLFKYKPVMDGYGWTPDWFASKYSVPIRITPTRYRVW